MIKQLTAALGLAALLVVSPADADYVVYTNRASFEAALKAETTETFNELGAQAKVYGGSGLSQANGLSMPITISSSNGVITAGSASSMGGYYPSYGTYLVGPISKTSTDGLTVNMSANKYTAAGADVADFGHNSVVNFFVTTALGAAFSSSVSVNASQPGASFGFLGVLVTSPNDYLTSLKFSSPVNGNQNVVIDNLSLGFAPQAVPEPTTMALMVVGSLAIGVTALRPRLRRRLA